MKANDFIKKYGINRAKDFVDKVIDHFSMGDDFKVDELKILIESHDFVENMGGISYIKKYFQSRMGSNVKMDLTPRLKQAIADVESCQ